MEKKEIKQQRWSTILLFCGFFLSWAGAILTGTGYGRPELTHIVEYKRMASWPRIAGPIILATGISVLMVAVAFCLFVRMKNSNKAEMLHSNPDSETPVEVFIIKPQDPKKIHNNKSRTQPQLKKPAVNFSAYPVEKPGKLTNQSNRYSQNDIFSIGKSTAL